jgi:hypothetical protein
MSVNTQAAGFRAVQLTHENWAAQDDSPGITSQSSTSCELLPRILIFIPSGTSRPTNHDDDTRTLGQDCPSGSAVELLARRQEPDANDRRGPTPERAKAQVVLQQPARGRRSRRRSRRPTARTCITHLHKGHASKTPVFGYHSGSELALLIPAFSQIPGVHKRTRGKSGKVI